MPSAPVVLKVNSAFHLVSHYLMHKGIEFCDFSGGERYLTIKKNPGLYLCIVVSTTGPFNTSCSTTLSPVHCLIGTRESATALLLNCRILF